MAWFLWGAFLVVLISVLRLRLRLQLGLVLGLALVLVLVLMLDLPVSIPIDIGWAHPLTYVEHAHIRPLETWRPDANTGKQWHLDDSSIPLSITTPEENAEWTMPTAHES